MKKYKIDHYDHFYQSGHDLKGCFFFETLEEVDAFVKRHQEAKRKWPDLFLLSEYVLTVWNGDRYVKVVEKPICQSCGTELHSHEWYYGATTSWKCPNCGELEYDPFAKLKG